MIRGVHHISLATTNLDKLVHCYRDLLGSRRRLHFAAAVHRARQMHVLLLNAP